jgi:hypothetical protein
MVYIKDTDTSTNNIISPSETTSGQKSYLKLNLLEQRVYTLTHKHFTRIDTEADQLENGISSLTKKLNLISSELELLQNEINKMDGSTKLLASLLISTKKAELENIQTKIDETNLKLKNITEHPLHKQNRKQFLGGLETSYSDYVKGIELVDKKDPCDYCFSLAEQGYNLSGIIKAVKQADNMHKQNNLESKLSTYALRNDRANYIDTYEELCKNHSDTTLNLIINAEERKIGVNQAALESLLNDSDKLTTLTLTLPEEVDENGCNLVLTENDINAVINVICEYVTCAQIKTFEPYKFPVIIELFMKAEDNDKQIELAKAIERSIGEQFFNALQEENTIKMERIATNFESSTSIAKDTKTCLTFKTQGQWINKKLERILDATHIDESHKKILAEKVLNDYKTIRQDDKKFNEAFPTFKTTGFAATPFLYRALNQYDSNSEIRLDLIDKKGNIKEGQYTLTCHLEAITQHLPFAKDLVNFTKKSSTPNNETLSITLPVECEEGLEKVHAFLTHLDPTQLRSTKQTEAIAIFQLCQHWKIEEHEVDIFHHFTETDLTDESLFTIACETNNQYLLHKSISGLLQQAAKSDRDYKNVNRWLIKKEPSIEKLDLTNLNLSDNLVELLESCKDLRELSLYGNEQLTDKSLSSIGELKNLTTLNLKGCQKLTKEGLDPLKELKLTSLTLPISDREMANEIAFGNDKWIQAYGIEIKEEDIGKDLEALPENILEILESTCPTDSSKKIKDTHMLVWMPQTIIMDGKEQNLTLNTFGQLIKKKHFSANKGGYRYISPEILKQIGDKTLTKGQWVLMTKDVLEGSRGKDYSVQQTLVSDLAKKSGMSYEVPTVLEATVCILAEYVSKGARLFSGSPNTYTRCQEKLEGDSYQVTVGGFASAGLYLRDDFYDNFLIGVAARWKFF